MNQIIQSLLERTSVRSFTDQEIPEEIVQQILKASVNAPTAGNQQLYTILRITDPEKKHRLSITCDNQPFIETAKLILVYCADCLKWYTAFKEAGCDPRDPGEGDLMLAVCDALIAAQNAVVAAQGLYRRSLVHPFGYYLKIPRLLNRFAIWLWFPTSAMYWIQAIQKN